jgi:exopolysaccharide production protein ExoZ
MRLVMAAARGSATGREDRADASPDASLHLLQSLRGVAVLLVVLYHLTDLSARLWNREFLGGWFGFGWAGVDLFFVLSGFIIHYIHHRDIARPAGLGRFVKKRLVRIYPLYLLVTLSVLPLYLLGRGEAYKRTPEVILKSLLFLPQGLGKSPVITVGWSLNHEMLFYACFALLILLGRRLGRAFLGAWLGLSLGATLLVMSGSLRESAHPLLYFVLGERNLEFGLGMLCAVLVLRHRVAGARVLLGLGVAAFIAAAWATLTERLPPSSHVHIACFGLAAALAVLGAAARDQAARSRGIAWLAMFGDASYSIYLTHGVLLVMLVQIGRPWVLGGRIAAWQVQFLALAVVLVFGCAMHHWLERPLTAWLRALILPRPRALPVREAEVASRPLVSVG